VSPTPGFITFTDDESDGERERRHDLEVDEGPQPIRPTSFISPMFAMPTTIA